MTWEPWDNMLSMDDELEYEMEFARGEAEKNDGFWVQPSNESGRGPPSFTERLVAGAVQWRDPQGETYSTLASAWMGYSRQSRGLVTAGMQRVLSPVSSRSPSILAAMPKTDN